MKQHNSLSLVLQRRESLLSRRGFRRILSLIGFETRWKTVWPARRSLEDWANRLEKEEEEGRLAGRRREGAAPRRARMSASIHPCGRRCTTHPAASPRRCLDPGISSCMRKLRASRGSWEACLKLSGRNSIETDPCWTEKLECEVTELMICMNHDDFFFSVGNK